SAQVTDTNGNMGTAPVRTVTVATGNSNGLSVDRSITKTGTGTIHTRQFSTGASRETLVAFVSSDGRSGSGQQSASVTGAGLKWRLVKRTNAQPGDAEIWASTASS